MNYSNPRAPQGARPSVRDFCPRCIYFNPCAPQGARRGRGLTPRYHRQFQSTRSARSATFNLPSCHGEVLISIHALRKERDSIPPLEHIPVEHFNPRAPQGARLNPPAVRVSSDVFQSTRSARSATETIMRDEQDVQFQSTRSARSATNGDAHAVAYDGFQSTRSARSATRATCFRGRSPCISIHALRKERDLCGASGSGECAISIHALRKERDSKSGHKRSLLRCIHNDYSPHMCFFLMFTSTNLIQLDF